MVEFTPMQWANWFRGSKSLTTNKDASLTAQASKVSHSPVATGSDITQTITENHYYTQPERTVEATERRQANIRFAAADTVRIVESLGGGVFFQRDDGFPAAILRFSNDASIGAENVAAGRKGILIYPKAGKEILSNTSYLLEHAGGQIYIEVYNCPMLPLGIALAKQL